MMSDGAIEEINIKTESIDCDESESGDFDEGEDSDFKLGQRSPKFGFETIFFEPKTERVDAIDEILEKKRADEQLSLPTAENLRNLVIKLRHKVPPQHRIEKVAGTRVPTAEQKAAMRELMPGKRIKKGLFNTREDQLIVDNWKAFCKIHNWDEQNSKPFLFLRQHITSNFHLKREKERKKFVQFLADGLPNRTLYSVYHRFRILYDTPKLKTRYTKEEDELIINHIEHNRNVDRTRMYADMAHALNRSRASVWRRYQILRAKRGYD